MLTMEPWLNVELTLCFTSPVGDVWAATLSGFCSCPRVEIRSVLSFPHEHSDELSIDVRDGRRPRVVMILVQEQILFLFAMAHPGTTQRRLALWARDTLNLHRPPSQTSVASVMTRGQELLRYPGAEMDHSQRQEMDQDQLAPAIDAVRALKLTCWRAQSAATRQSQRI
jgi:hypothetical protein